jgi:hypothetical protein
LRVDPGDSPYTIHKRIFKETNLWRLEVDDSLSSAFAKTALINPFLLDSALE